MPEVFYCSTPTDIVLKKLYHGSTEWCHVQNSPSRRPLIMSFWRSFRGKLNTYLRQPEYFPKMIAHSSNIQMRIVGFLIFRFSVDIGYIIFRLKELRGKAELLLDSWHEVINFTKIV